ncbi:hypothetical protein CATYP_01655 [Corynebacterium atypicum]|uniref:DUF2569 family protein n=1 Tax=Corynebacterium atypicum TaxID=191610 RepID=A0ABN4DFB7_9CORY|nr:hypothetical protein [Corynebacterium atypicum]AIG63597.1 hypothetical protein CATYP_01655 [Corynebacterium atypicum]
MTNLGRPAAHAASDPGPPETHQRAPETVRYLVWSWWLIVAGEILHQVLSVAIVVADPSALRAAAKETLAGAQAAEGAEVSQAMLDLAVYASAGFSALVGIVIQGILLWCTMMVAKRHRWSAGSRRMLLFFSIYLVIRALAVFGLGAGASAAPLWLIGVDGALQVVTGVAAGVALAFVARKETVAWTDRPIDDGYR